MTQSATMEEFEALLKDSFETDTPKEGSVVKGKVIAVEAGQAIIDIGYKMEGRIDLKEFESLGETPELVIGQEVEVFLDRVENSRGEASVSREKARREEAWDRLETAHSDTLRVDGVIFGRVKGGFTVDLGGAVAFLPGSQVDVRPVRDAAPLMGMKQPFIILKMDRKRGNIVVSRRAILEESRAEQRAEVVGNLKEGDTVDGIVKNITEYGAFIDLGGVDGLIHITDFSWGRINHPSEIVSIGDEITVQIIDYNKETSRISLGLKQLVENPWQTIPDKYSIGDTIIGKIVSIMNYGIFIELEKGIEGLIHISEISWTKNIQNLQDQYKVGDSLESKILFIDANEQKISLGIKQLTKDPWDDISSQVGIGDKKEGAVNKVTKFGAYVDLGKDIEGFVRNTDFHWTKNPLHPKEFVGEGDTIKFVVIDISDKDRKILLSMKELADNPWSEIVEKYSSGDKLKGSVSAVNDSGVVIDMGDDVVGLVPSDKISKELKKDYLPSIEPGDSIDLLVVEVKEQDKNVILMLDHPDAD